MPEGLRPGKVRIGRFSGGRFEQDGIHILVRDEISGLHVMEITLSVQEIGAVMFGSMEADCSYNVMPNRHLLGMKREVRSETIYVPAGLKLAGPAYSATREDPLVQKALAPYEVDGWRVLSLTDLTNSHRRVQLDGNALVQLAMKADLEGILEDDAELSRGSARLVAFIRYVHPETGEPVLRP